MIKVKICGLRTMADVEKVNQSLPEYVGFVFADTGRFVTDEQAFCMRQALDPRIQAVGVFVNEPPEHIVCLYNQGIIDMAQLHGEESEVYIRELKQNIDIGIIKAVKVQDIKQIYVQLSKEADYMLFDTYKKGMPGGTGERFPLELLEQSLKECRAKGRIIKPYFLAGGLDSRYVSEVLGRMERNAFHECFAVDVSTGVETDGAKDGAKIKQFIETVRSIKGDIENERKSAK